MRKAVLSCLLAYILGVLAFDYLPVSIQVFAVLLILIAMGIRYTVFWKGAKKLPIVVAGFFIIGLFYTSFVYSSHTSSLAPYVDETVTVKGRIVTVSDTNAEYANYELVTESVTFSDRDTSTEINLRETLDLSLAKYESETTPEPYQFGDVILAVVKLEKPSAPLNDGDADYRSYQKARGVFYCTTGSYETSMLAERQINYWNIFDLAQVARQYFIDLINTYFSGDAAALLRGMLLSDKTGFSDEFAQRLADTGMTHITVASGLHVNCVLAVLLWVLFSCRVRKRYAYPAAMLVLWAYAFLQGMTPSIIRAVVMTCIFLIGELLSRDYDRRNTLYVTAFLMVLFDPYMIYSVGFQLSFGAVLGIVLFAAPIDSFLVRIVRFKKLSSLISVSIAAQILIMPVLAFYFNKVSLYSVLANLLIVPVLTVTLGLGFLFFAVGAIGVVGHAVSFVLGLFVSYINGIIYVVSVLPFATVDVFTINIWKIIAYYLLFTVVYLLLMKKDKKYIFTATGVFAAFVICLIAVHIYTSSFLQVTFLNVGQGDAALIKIPGGKTVVIDGGGSAAISSRDLGEKLFVPYLKRSGVNTIDYAIVSHFEKDHAQGIAAAVRLMDVKNLVFPYRRSDENLEYKNLIEQTARKKGINILYFKEGDSLDIDGVHIIAFAPTQRNAENRAFSENNKSLVLKLTYGETSFLFTGDIELEAESKVAGYGDAIRADVLKVAHHGSKTSSSAKFIKTCAPKYAIISEGKNNVYGFPARETVNTLVKNNVDIYQTSECGDISFYVGRDEIKWIDTFYERPSYEETFLKSGASIWLKNPQPVD